VVADTAAAGIAGAGMVAAAAGRYKAAVSSWNIPNISSIKNLPS
jgi:hypothetical protein